MKMDVVATPSAALDGHRKQAHDSVCLSWLGSNCRTHYHGILNGAVQLLSWQVAGSSSRPLPNWLLTKVDEMTDLVPLDQTFPGGRPTASGKHIEWDVLFIRVKPAKDYLRAGST
jgi:hypothetical protein